MAEAGGLRQTEQALPMRRPLLAIACVFALGVWLAGLVNVSALIPWSLAGVFMLASLLFLIKRKGGILRFYLWLLVFVSLGWARGILPQVPSVEAPSQMVALAGLAQDGWRRVKGGQQLILDSNSIGKPGGEYFPWPGKVKMTLLVEPGQQCPNVLPGDEVRALVRISKPSTRHNYGTRNSSRALSSRGIYWVAVANDCHVVLVGRKPAFSPRRLAQKARYALDRLMSTISVGDEAGRAVYSALSIGETGDISDQTRLNFQRAGLSHLLAVSGLHLGTVAIGLYLFLSFLLCRIRPAALRIDVRRIAAALVIPAVGFYVLLVGARLPSIRASVVIFCFLVAIIIRRKSDSLNVLSAAWLLVLGLWPQSLFDTSFQLSFAAAFSVVFFAPRWAEALGASFSSDKNGTGFFRRARDRILQLALVSVAATVGTAPVVVWHFHQVSLSGLLSNLLAVPLASWLVVPVGIVSAVLLVFSSTLSAVVASLGIWLSQGLVWLANLFSAPVWASFNVANLGAVSLLAWYSLWLASIKLHMRKMRFVAGLAALTVCGSLTWQALDSMFSEELRFTAIDVGQGDCLLLRFPGGDAWLVDGGGTYSGRYDVGMGTVAPALWALGVDHLDVIVATHRDPDHVGGLASVLKLFHPRELWSSAPLDEDAFSRPLAQAAASRGTKLRLLHSGVHLKKIEGVSIKVLWPPKEAEGLEENERSLVLRLSYGKRSVLLTGDLEKDGERGLVNSGVILRSDILKVGHHGSRNASSKEFINIVKPSLAVISVGARNHFGLPTPEVLQRLHAAGVRVLRTDMDGQITVSTDGQDLQVETWKDSAGRN